MTVAVFRTFAGILNFLIMLIINIRSNWSGVPFTDQLRQNTSTIKGYSFRHTIIPKNKVLGNAFNVHTAFIRKSTYYKITVFYITKKQLRLNLVIVCMISIQANLTKKIFRQNFLSSMAS